jgi:hydrogenase-4 component B
LPPLLELFVIATFVLFVAASLSGIFSKRASFTTGALAAGVAASTSLLAILGKITLSFSLWKVTATSSAEISISPFSGYFLLISSLVWIGTCVYSLKYDDDYPNSLSSLLLLTMLSMVVILLSGDAVLFLIGWESMTLSSFFMILQGKGNRSGVLNAAYLFLAFGEGSTVFVMLSFAGIFSSAKTLDFLSSNSIIATGSIASWVFLASLIGFGLKMGVAPFHMSEWLPIAHSSAPSNASALLSATLTLMGVYGLIDVVTHLGSYQLWWGWIALAIGGISAMLGALFASASEHTKGLPAYSTIENNGLIIVAIGAYILSSYYGLTLLADLALIAALFHAFSHSISKGSLFLLMGWVSKIKNSFDLNKIGPIISIGKKASYIGGLFTVLSLAAAPPLAGFVSEWMILEVLFQSFRYGDVASQIIGTLVGAFSALAAGIIIVAMTKVYGYGILWSEKNPLASSVVSSSETGQDTTKKSSLEISSSLIYFAVLIVGIGIAAPAIFFLGSNALFSILGNNAFQELVSAAGPVISSNHLGVPLYFVILSGNPFGGFSPTFTAIFMIGLLSVPFLISLIGGHWRIKRTPGWFGGQPQPSTASEIYNSFGYSTPIRLMLRFLFRTKENVIQIGGVKRTLVMSPEEYFVDLEVLDVFKRFYDILGRWTLSFSSLVGRKLMPGRLSNYLIYIIVALIFVMLYVLVTVL